MAAPPPEVVGAVVGAATVVRVRARVVDPIVSFGCSLLIVAMLAGLFVVGVVSGAQGSLSRCVLPGPSVSIVAGVLRISVAKVVRMVTSRSSSDDSWSLSDCSSVLCGWSSVRSGPRKGRLVSLS